MVTLISGQKCKMFDLVKTEPFQISVSLSIGNCETDVSCFAVDKQGQLSDDRYFVFYNQLSTPEGAIKKNPDTDIFTVHLSALPDTVEKLVLTAAIDGEAVMGDLKEGSVIFGNQEAGYFLNGGQFQKEKAIILAEIYRYNGQWRLGIVGKGFHGGLSALLAHFGGEEVKEETENIPPVKPVTLEKKERIHKMVQEKAPHLVDLTKKAIVSLEKKHLTEIKAQVILVLDASGSMYGQYQGGRVQRILDKVLPLALLFDDNEQLESWAFATKYKQLEDVTVNNIRDYVIQTDGGWKKWGIGGTNNEPAVMEVLYQKHKASRQPVYIIFISDGGVGKTRKIKEMMKTSSYAPMFWQFIGIHGSNYGILEELDTLQGRCVDNANFFALDDIDSISDEALYDRLMNEFPLWINAARQKHILP